MEKIKLDTMDNAIIRLLTKDGRMPVGEMAKQLNVTAPTVRKRIKTLEKKGIFKVTGVINPDRHNEMITALVAMSVHSEGKLGEILDRVSNLPNVTWAGIVTGRYDIIADVVCVGGKDELYQFTSETILEQGNIIRSESFIIMKSKDNWLRLPKSVEKI